MNFSIFVLLTFCLFNCRLNSVEAHEVSVEPKLPIFAESQSAGSPSFASDMQVVLNALKDLPDTLKNVKNILNNPITTTTTSESTPHFRRVRHPAVPLFSHVPAPVPSLYMTGSPRLDKILNCPCRQSQLTLLGVEGYSFPTTYEEPGELVYGTNDYEYGHGGEGWSKLKEIGQSKGDTLAKVFNHILGVPGKKLTLLQPLVVGASHTAAKATNGFARFTSHAAHVLPVAAERKAQVFDKLAVKAGHVGGVVFKGLSKLATSLSAVQQKVHDDLPYKFAVLSHATDRVTSNIDQLLDHF